MITKNTLRKYRYDIAIGVTILLFIIFIVIFRESFGVLSDRESFENFIRGFGPLAPIVVIVSIVLEVIFAPIPGFVPAISSGFLFGHIEGSAYAFIGNVLGSALAFFLARKFGRYLLGRIVNTERIEKYEKAIQKRETLLLMLYFIPIFPTDIISMAFGLSGIRFKKFIIFSSLGYACYALILAYFGDYLATIYF